MRAILHDRMLYLRNLQTGRWPAGNPETGYLDCDGSPTKTLTATCEAVLDGTKTPGTPTTLRRTAS
ncbi:MAG: hypothetical protein KF833_03830 [Verrucomicrobiae bacterium]|nr:hypothetical protein [Verrucomicrobiae bacterium]